MNSVENPLVSIVVPVYNSERYVDNFMSSLINQTYKNIEIILVNDGSTDGTPEIISRYQKSDDRIKIINKANQGIQYARRDGINIASGVYIKTMDNDDVLIEDAVERLVARALETDADMVAAPFYFCPQGKEPFLSTPLQFDEINGVDYFREVCFKRAYWATWTTLHKRSLYRNNDIQLDPEIMMVEDTILTTQLAIYSRKVAAIHTPIVRFTVRNDSVSNVQTIDDRRFRDLRKYPLWIADFVQKQGLAESLAKEVAFLSIRVAFESVIRHRFELLKDDFKQIRGVLRQYPELKSELSRREKKVIATFGISSWLGEMNVRRYSKQGKL